MKHAFIMDPLEKVKAYKDTTYFLMLAAQEKGHEVHALQAGQLWLEGNRLWGWLTQLTVSADEKKPFLIQAHRRVALEDMDVVWVRTDPPFDRSYLYTTLMLDFLPPATKVINRPSGLRNWNEKLATHYFSQFMPKSLVSNNADEIRRFAEDLGARITLKPVDGHGGRGIVFLAPGDANFDQLIGFVTQHGRHYAIAQEFLPAAEDGDKRVLLLNGDPMGGILRVHPEGKELNNLDAGGTAHAVALTSEDRAICAALKPQLLAQGIFFCGIDIIGGKLIEINVTSPTGLREMSDFAGVAYHHQVIEAIPAFAG